MRISRGAARRADKQNARDQDRVLNWLECTAEHACSDWKPAVKAAARGLLDALTESGYIEFTNGDGQVQTPVQARFNAAVGAGPR
jgi:hypothetical protein